MAIRNAAAASPKKSNSENFIKSLAIKRSTSSLIKRVGKDVCSICLDDVAVNEKVCLLNCTHMFHENCIVKWLGQNNTCPLCRCQLYEKDSEDVEPRRVRSVHPRMSVRRSTYTFRFSL